MGSSVQINPMAVNSEAIRHRNQVEWNYRMETGCEWKTDPSASAAEPGRIEMMDRCGPTDAALTPEIRITSPMPVRNCAAHCFDWKLIRKTNIQPDIQADT